MFHHTTVEALRLQDLPPPAETYLITLKRIDLLTSHQVDKEATRRQVEEQELHQVCSRIIAPIVLTERDLVIDLTLLKVYKLQEIGCAQGQTVFHQEQTPITQQLLIALAVVIKERALVNLVLAIACIVRRGVCDFLAQTIWEMDLLYLMQPAREETESEESQP